MQGISSEGGWTCQKNEKRWQRNVQFKLSKATLIMFLKCWKNPFRNSKKDIVHFKKQKYTIQGEKEQREGKIKLRTHSRNEKKKTKCLFRQKSWNGKK